MTQIETVQMFIGNKKVFDALEKHFNDKRYSTRLIHTDTVTGEIVIENNRNDTLNDLVNLSMFYPSVYVQVEIYQEFTTKSSKCRYVINNGNSTKVLASYDYFRPHFKL